MIPYLYMLSLCEGIVPRRDQLNDLCRIWHDDIRRILRELAFWGRRAARDGLEDGSATREGDPPRKVIGPDRSIGAGLPPLSNILLGSPEYALGVVDRWPASYCIELPATLDIAPTDLLGDWADSLPQPLRCSQPVPTTTSDSPDRVELIPQPTLAALPGLAPGISCRLETDPCFASVKLNPGGAASVVAATRIFTASNHPDTLLGFIDAYVELISFTDAYVGVKQWRKEQVLIHGMDSYEAGVSDRSSRPKTLHKQSLPGTMARRSGAPDHSDVDVQITWLLSLGARRQLDRHAGPNPPLEGPSVDVVAGNIADAIARKDSKASRTEAAREAAWFTLQELGVARCTGLRGGAEATSRNPAVVKVLGPLLATASAMRTGVDFYPQMVYYAGLIARIDRRMADELTGDMSRRRRNGRM
ncbi:MAG: hypothetical protein BJ554DRAFT_5401 [Olpidium bornovanus]|uniref:Uncharacterized protein n=1 Tax=Olpidium bornovanus TaxID=278681 RepID=A0A8H7ZZP9_9FUNG|nr:MAG: hypothetical protein BJ554DRAFT_5401 [Olpidium bornovanus]